ncbi:MAG: hypothetical protein NC110_00325 [Ruminococcus sp.]|nr:hypothetical protein [Ruminococcus sp.]MCM1440588.1 hypothetical protein [Roseburia sp.]MCM1543722.1 hypothetical protein [Ruminococcus sp.]
MARFGDLGIESGAIIGKGIEIEELFGKRILIEKTKISKSKFTGKNNSGLRLQMQVVLASFNETPDEDGDFYVKKPDGTPDGERRCCFTGSDILIEGVQAAEEKISSINAERAANGEKPLELYPIDTTIVKVGKCFNFT